jgi:hypothetical protein
MGASRECQLNLLLLTDAAVIKSLNACQLAGAQIAAA